mmetsp:Transcript_22135/g.48216  ORF Transcript_22135/g.48216 Transcript_22135/m.48216 type:complete len:114 (+) Transcript_22135:302-643(+)
MASMNFSAGKQFVKPPQRGIFPLDHDAECKTKMKEYLECLKEEKNKHHKCRELSKDYLQCRMDHELMAKENLDEMGFSKETEITETKEYDKSKEREGYIAGKHITGKLTGWLW